MKIPYSVQQHTTEVSKFISFGISKYKSKSLLPVLQFTRLNNMFEIFSDNRVDKLDIKKAIQIKLLRQAPK